jgi:hypothetical protein
MKDGWIIGLSAAGAGLLIVGGTVGYFWNDLVPPVGLKLVAPPATQAAPIPPPPKMVKFRVRGGAWITRKTGQSDLIRGMKLYVIPSSSLTATQANACKTIAADEIADIPKYPSLALDIRAIAAWLNARAVGESIQLIGVEVGYRQWASFPSVFNRMISTDSSLVGETNIDGKFDIEFEAAQGSAIWATFDTSYNDIGWMIPLRARDMELSLHNDNAIYISSRD